MIASSKQRQEHNNLTTIQREKLKGVHEHSMSLQLQKTQNQNATLTRMDKVVIENYYHMTIMDENVNYMELANLSSNYSITLGPPIYLYFHILDNLFTCTN